MTGKIEYIEKAFEAAEVKKGLHPLVSEWFFGKYADFSLTQLYGVKTIWDRKNVLICAPTGGTKTLTAFLSIINYLVGLALKDELEDKIYAVYLSPLKALSGDIEVNLKMPLKEIKELADSKGLKMQEIRVGLRTGDTSASERAKMVRKVPHIFVTTPESLSIVLLAPKFGENLHALEFVIVDEIHALNNKRGVYLMLTLERLNEVSLIEPVRIGLSATISPLDEVARFLVGTDRDCLIADVKMNKKVDIALITPGKELSEGENYEVHKKLYHILDELIGQHKTTLIFTNTRAATERIIHYLDMHFPGKYTEVIGAHHSSMSKANRFEIEERLRKGELKVVVSSTSLELGIDIGFIDLVVMMRSPKSVARALQRCLPYDSPILCADGTYRRIGEIVENKEFLEVVSYDEQRGFIFNKINNLHDNGQKDILSFTLECGEVLNCTPEHPILTDKGWKEAKELGLEDSVAEIRSEIKFQKKEPYFYELLPTDKIFVQNKDNFYQRIVDNYMKENKLNAKSFTEKFGVPYSRFIDIRRLRGRKKSIRLDYFLKACSICEIDEEEYIHRLKYLKTKGTKWPEWSLRLTEELMWLAGIVATDGCIVKSKKGMGAEYYKIKIGNKSEVMINKIKEIVGRYGVAPYSVLKKGIYHLEFGSNLLAYAFMSLGIVCKNKSFDLYVSDKVFSLPNKLIYAYLEGIFEGDGNLNLKKGQSSGMIRLFSASKEFSIGLHKLLSRIGINNKVSKSKIKASLLIKKVSDGDLYCVGVFRKEDLKKFFENVPGFGEKTLFGKKETEKFLPYLSLKEGYNPFVSFSKVTEKKLLGKQRVYNLTLEKEPNNFIAGNTIVHNCGRAGHKLHENPKGRFIVMDRDDLVECAVLMKNIVEKKIDKIEFPKNCLDVLSQQIFAMAITKVWNADAMLKVIRRSYCYADLKKEDFLDVVSYLTGEYDLQRRYVYAKIWHDPVTNDIGKRGKLARMIYMTNIGTIPEEGFIEVVISSPVEKKGQIVGKIDEAFLERLKKGDIFVLGGAKYQFTRAMGMKAFVIADVSRNPTIPSWFSEMLPLSFDVACDIGRFRRLVKERIGNKKEAIDFIKEYTYCDETAASEVYSYMKEQFDFSELPTDEMILVEKFKEEKEYLLFHTMYGRRVNDVLSRAYAYAAARVRGRDVEIGINDNGFFIAGESLDENKILANVNSKKIDEILKEAIEKTDVLQRRFRHCASRSLMILRNYKGRSKSVGKQQVHSHFLLAAVKKISNEFPILREARREVLEDLMDVNNAKKVLQWIENGRVKVKLARIPIVSPFGLNLVMQSHADLVRMEDKASFLKRMHELHLKVIGHKGPREEKIEKVEE